MAKTSGKAQSKGAKKTRARAARPRVVALLPAHNEQDIIESTIESLMNQSAPLEYVLVIADNCTDDTVKIVRACQKKYGADRLKLTKTVKNKHKKAGALNHGFRKMRGNPDFVFGMDADTILDRNIIKAGLKQFRREPKTGGICSAYRALPLKPEATRWERFLWRLQNIEFGLANAWRVENYKSARVLPGVSVMFRAQALKDVRKLHRGTIWATDSLVEDYRLTLELKEVGWGVKSSLEMISWSDVPLKIRGKGGLFDQRQRWYSGTVDEIRRKDLRRHTHYEIFTISLLTFNLLMRTLLYGTYGLILLTGGIIQWVSFFLLLPVLAAVIQFSRWVKYTDQRDKWQGLMTILLIPNELYAMFRETVYAYAIWLSYRRPGRAW
jgi:cellulose synthase/poly-beta-1,6-N-acetylglucosamine synthase-like glycosyltransferase